MKVAQALLLISAIAFASTLRIGLGNWGLPSPFLFYPRGPGYVITSFVFDTLTWKNSTGIIPWLAQSWEQLNSTAWVFHLRKAYWSDGVPITAQDVVFTFNYLKEHHWTWRSLDSIAYVKALNSTTVLVVLKRPNPFFLDQIASTVFIIPKHIWEKVKDPYAFRSKEAFIGSGPYLFASYSPQLGYVFKANPLFWGPKPKFEKLLVVTSGIFNARAAVTALVNKEIDTVALMGKAWRLIKFAKMRIPNLEVQKGPMYWVLFLGFNLDKYPYNVTEFRRAIAYSLNLKELVLKAVGSLEAAIPGTPNYVPPYSYFYNPDVPKYPYNPTKAEEILNSLGIRDVNGDGCRELNGRTWRPLLVTTKNYLQEALIIRDMLKKVGICVEVKTLQSMKQLDQVVRRGAFDLEINGHGADGNDPTALSWFFKVFGTPWKDEEYYRIVKEITSSPTVKQAIEYAKKAQVVIAKKLPRIALYYPYEYVLTLPSANVKWFFTYGGIDGGIPLPYNKLALLR
ncbi:hypothetical protein IPA_07495 [Ignicoccus pacificus DSM 13166]|uniref:Solute-binding protein family 5 domain-containing protein n=1 Tax=Ignicoccus pacificus DSM 13166 TaxID=940294 RepID=A0A977KBR3_9CREN|nr:hypothetical protein IPA_07495 [Ignicoccus pacificus DSM 13166]